MASTGGHLYPGTEKEVEILSSMLHFIHLLREVACSASSHTLLPCGTKTTEEENFFAQLIFRLLDHYIFIFKTVKEP